MSHRVEVLHRCVICGECFSSKKALRAYLKKHSKEQRELYIRTSFYINREVWERFKKLCHEHHTATCSALNALLEAMVKAAEAGLPVPIVSQNPIVIQVVQQFIGSKPRGKKEVLEVTPTLPANLPVCRYAIALYARTGGLLF